MPLRIEQSDADVLLWIKAVPGASRDQVAGLLGERLKVRTAAAPEAGKANAAICRAVARALKLKPNRVAVDSGKTHSQKILRIRGANVDDIRAALQDAL